MTKNANWKNYILKAAIFLLLAAAVIFPTNQSKAYAGTVNLKGDISYDTSRDFKSLMTSEVLKDTYWVEMVLEKDGKVVGEPVWFEKTASNWKFSVKNLNGSYEAKFYAVNAVNADNEVHTEDSNPFAKVSFGVVKTSITSLTSSSTTVSDKTAIKVTLKGLKTTYGAKKVNFLVYNTAGKKVCTKKSVYDKKTGNYSVIIKAPSLNKKPGTYKIKVELTDNKGIKKIFQKTTKATLVGASTKVVAKVKNNTAGTIKFATTKNIVAADDVKSVKFRVWCNKSDKKTYTNVKKSSTGKYSVTVNVKDHGYHFGKYNAEVLVTLKNGKTIVAAKTSSTFAPKNFVVMKKVEKNKKTIIVFNPTVTKNVTANVWSDKSNGTDKTSYKVKAEGNHLKVTINLRKLKYSGKVNVRFNANGKKIKTVTFNVTNSQIQKNGWYYEKAANGTTYKYYYKNGSKLKDLTSVLNIKTQKLRIEVNRALNTVTVYAYDSEKKAYNTPVIAFACSVGLPSTPTPTGTYHTDRKHRWKMLMGPSWGQYATHFVNGIYFHSVAGSTQSVHNIKAYAYNKLGSAASHGCIRLCVRDAKWIYDHCAIGSTVYVYDNSNFSGPLGKPATIKISPDTDYDPTDPAV